MVTQSMLNALVGESDIAWNPAISEIDLRRLRSAISLYHTVQSVPGIDLHRSAVQKAELVIMQHHTMTILDSPKQSLPPTIIDSVLPLHSIKRNLWTAILVTMAVWVSTFKSCIHPVLLKKAQLVIDVDPDVFAAVPEFTRDDPIEAAAIFERDDDGTVVQFDRCHVTMFPMEELICSPWKCDSCKRLCLTPKQWLLDCKDAANPDCMFCGTPLHQ